MRPLLSNLLAAVTIVLVAGPVPASSTSGHQAEHARALRPAAPHMAAHRAGLGALLSTKDGGDIDGFDVDQSGSDAVLSSSGSIEIFDQKSGKVLTTYTPPYGRKNSYGIDGIFFGDVALVTRYHVPKGTIYATRTYDTMNPVTAGTFSGAWTPPIEDLSILQSAENQTTSTSVLYAIELKNQDKPDLLVSDIAANTIELFHLDPNDFSLGAGPQLAQDLAANKAVIAYSPDGGAVGGEAPINALIDVTTGKVTRFTGLNEGPYGAGDVNGIAVDPNTGIAATTTELNAQVEFYDLKKQAGTAVQLPCTGSGDQGNSGAGIAADPVHKLFLVTEASYGCNGNTSAIVVYDEHGNEIEAISGFDFYTAEPRPAINPSERRGWVFGPGLNQLQQFFY
jgi:hypothetical protein